MPKGRGLNSFEDKDRRRQRLTYKKNKDTRTKNVKSRKDYRQDGETEG